MVMAVVKFQRHLACIFLGRIENQITEKQDKCLQC